MGKWGLNVSVRPHFFCLLDRSFISICWDLNSFFFKSSSNKFFSEKDFLSSEFIFLKLDSVETYFDCVKIRCEQVV